MFLTRLVGNSIAARRSSAVALSCKVARFSISSASLFNTGFNAASSHSLAATSIIPVSTASRIMAKHRFFSTAEVNIQNEDLEFTKDKTADSGEDSQYTNVPFSSLNLSSSTMTALENNFKYKNMSTVQERVLSLLPTDADLLVRAKTGTGKTLAFLIAAVESVISRFKSRPPGVPILILSPTRELALQIAREAESLVSPRRWRVASAVGGESRGKNIREITQFNCDILVATPGRLNDLLNNEPAVRKQLQGLKMLVYDEADILLDMGFTKEIQDINFNLPKERQTYMFSATISKEVRSIASTTLRPDHVFIDTVPSNENDTHLKIKQTHVVGPHSQTLALLHDVITKHRESTLNSKILVFFNTTKTTNFSTDVFNNLDGMDVLQIHSKLTQQQRSRVADRYRRAQSAILFTTDVSARGVDYPGITLVIQVGPPPSREQYIHRIGRTGRAGKSGESTLILSTYDKHFLDQLFDLPIQKHLSHTAYSGPRTDSVQSKISSAVSRIPEDERVDVYMAQLGNAISQMAKLGVRKETAVESANSFSQGVLLLSEPPEISQRSAQNMGIANLSNIRIRGVSSNFSGSGSMGMYPRGGRPNQFQRGDQNRGGNFSFKDRDHYSNQRDRYSEQRSRRQSFDREVKDW
ncbi:hypothetical protein QVD99_007041 [Batrachochytrium dendrobatidis]|nr:hypothetical protein O5D80_007687 [Batrachochytrium dendrobatidis]KAK5666279.1 hypothetical protein QVD99_007041 [Batrachochytrium dendrobatidis]